MGTVKSIQHSRMGKKNTTSPPLVILPLRSRSCTRMMEYIHREKEVLHSSLPFQFACDIQEITWWPLRKRTAPPIWEHTPTGATRWALYVAVLWNGSTPSCFSFSMIWCATFIQIRVCISSAIYISMCFYPLVFCFVFRRRGRPVSGCGCWATCCAGRLCGAERRWRSLRSPCQSALSPWRVAQ